MPSSPRGTHANDRDADVRDADNGNHDLGLKNHRHLPPSSRVPYVAPRHVSTPPPWRNPNDFADVASPAWPMKSVSLFAPSCCIRLDCPMQINTSRFGVIPFKPEDVFQFPHGLIGLESCTRWVLLADADIDSVGWLQSANLPEIAAAVISPRRFLPDYQVRVTRTQLSPLEMNSIDQAFVLNLLALNEGRLTVNLKAPLIINLNRRLGRQVVTSDDQPVQFELAAPAMKHRRAA